MLARPQSPVLPPPPIVSAAGHALFVDFDGTLVPLAERPDDVVADSELIDLLAELHRALDGRLAIVSGRSIDQLDAMLGRSAATLVLAGSHGAELRYQGRRIQPPRPSGLDAAADDVRRYVDAHPGTIAEIKSFGVALHYRTAPRFEADAQAAAIAIAARHGLAVQPGKMMIELHVAGADKGDAVMALMAMASMQGSLPIVIGDDLTDEPALAMAERLGGFGILVGSGRDTAAVHGLADVPDVRRWLGLVAEAGV